MLGRPAHAEELDDVGVVELGEERGLRHEFVQVLPSGSILTQNIDLEALNEVSQKSCRSCASELHIARDPPRPYPYPGQWSRYTIRRAPSHTTDPLPTPQIRRPHPGQWTAPLIRYSQVHAYGWCACRAVRRAPGRD